VRGALWWLRQSHSVNEAHRTKFKANSARSPFFAIFQFLAPKNYWGLAPIWVRRCKLHVPRYRLVKVSWKSVQPFPRTVVSYFWWTEKKQKKSVKHIRSRLISGCVNYHMIYCVDTETFSSKREWVPRRPLQISHFFWGGGQQKKFWAPTPSPSNFGRSRRHWVFYSKQRAI